MTETRHLPSPDSPSRPAIRQKTVLMPSEPVNAKDEDGSAYGVRRQAPALHKPQTV